MNPLMSDVSQCLVFQGRSIGMGIVSVQGDMTIMSLLVPLGAGEVRF